MLYYVSYVRYHCISAGDFPGANAPVPKQDLQHPVRPIGSGLIQEDALVHEEAHLAVQRSRWMEWL